MSVRVDALGFEAIGIMQSEFFVGRTAKMADGINFDSGDTFRPGLLGSDLSEILYTFCFSSGRLAPTCLWLGLAGRAEEGAASPSGTRPRSRRSPSPIRRCRRHSALRPSGSRRSLPKSPSTRRPTAAPVSASESTLKHVQIPPLHPVGSNAWCV